MADFVPQGRFPEADSAWLPTLSDIEYRKAQGDEHYANCGFECIEVDSERYPLISARLETLKIRFDERYAYRMINAETLERWQMRLQNRMDEIVDRYEFAYSAYDQYSAEMLAKAGYDRQVSETYTESENSTVESEAGGSDTESESGRTIDTPDSAINASSNYADSLQEADRTTQYGRTDRDAGTRDLTHQLDRLEELGGGPLAESIHAAIDAYRSLDSQFVGEFENSFLNVLWY